MSVQDGGAASRRLYAATVEVEVVFTAFPDEAKERAIEYAAEELGNYSGALPVTLRPIVSHEDIPPSWRDQSEWKWTPLIWGEREYVTASEWLAARGLSGGTETK